MNKFSCRLLLFLLLGWSSMSYGLVCNQTTSTLNPSFGSRSSFSVSGGTLTTSMNTIISCLNLGSLGSSDEIDITFKTASSLSGTQAFLKSTEMTNSDTIPINFCPLSSGCGSTLSQGNTLSLNSSSLAEFWGSSIFTLPFYFHTVPGSNVAAGTYQVTVTVTVEWKICITGVGIFCVFESGSTDLPISLTLTVLNDCNAFTTDNIHFGEAMNINKFETKTGSVAITCTKGSRYTVSLDDGMNSADNIRHMSNGYSRIAYDILKENGLRWHMAGENLWESGDSSLLSGDGLTRTYNYKALILSGQKTPEAGEYTDRLTLNVVF